MKRFRILIRAALGFSRTETNAFIVLLPLMIVLIFSQPLYRLVVQPETQLPDTLKLNALLATWQWKDSTAVHNKVQPAATTREHALFSFDPNRATDEQLLRLGFSKFQLDRLTNYRTKGGKFFLKADLLKLYGMDTSLYQRLYPYIDLPIAKNVAEAKPVLPSTQADINQADTLQLKEVYGIGSKLASRIIRYREKLGGFVSMQQLREVYGLDSGVVKKMILKFKVANDFVPRQLKINHVEASELAQHPYMKMNMAKAIVAYRYQHGPFVQLSDLLKIQLVTPTELTRVKPYLTLNP